LFAYKLRGGYGGIFLNEIKQCGVRRKSFCFVAKFNYLFSVFRAQSLTVDPEADEIDQAVKLCLIPLLRKRSHGFLSFTLSYVQG
jgi:hypothetical protein